MNAVDTMTDRRSNSSGRLKTQLYESITSLTNWVQANDYSGYDTFDGLNSRLLRPLSFETKFLRTVLQQGVRRFPLNLRPILGIAKSRSTKAMGFFARGFMRMHDATGDESWRIRAESMLEWLQNHTCTGYSGACWGNHFDYQSRSGYSPKDLPSVVWTSLIGHAFLDAYEQYRNQKYLRVAVTSCEHIMHDLGQFAESGGTCIGYFPGQQLRVHNASVLGASLLARTSSFTSDDDCKVLARSAIQYTAHHQRSDWSWFYGEASNLHWVDNFHTAYVLDSFKRYTEATRDDSFLTNLVKGYEYWKGTFFLADGTPRYYDHKTLPIDIQCCSQAIDTFVFFADRDPAAIEMASRVARWTIAHMQDSSGYFYYRRYSRWLVNRTATLHWGQATMLCALAGLYSAL